MLSATQGQFLRYSSLKKKYIGEGGRAKALKPVLLHNGPLHSTRVITRDKVSECPRKNRDLTESRPIIMLPSK